MIDQILARAAEIWEKQQFDGDEEVDDLYAAWNQGVHEFLKTDEDAVTLLGELAASGDTYMPYFWSEASGDTILEFIRSALIHHQESPFIKAIRERIPGYEQELEKRMTRARAQLAGQA